MENLVLLSDAGEAYPVAQLLLDEEMLPVDGEIATDWLVLGDTPGTLYITVIPLEA